MKVLLVGEFSGFHLNLKKGLEKLGHEVTLVASGDGWKKIQSDLNIPQGISKLSKISALFKQYLLVNRLRGFDIVQFINPIVFSHPMSLNEYFIKKLIRQNKKSYLIAAGSDCYYWKDYHQKFRYSPHDDWEKIDNKGKENLWKRETIKEWNEKFANMVDGIIPIMYEYRIGYENFKNVKSTIPIPIDLDSIQYSQKLGGKIVIFHGLNREGFKGTKYIKAAMLKIQEDYLDEVEVIIKGQMPLNEYLEVMKKTNIVIDQALSYSYGVNAVIAMAMGKVTLSGCEIECLNEFNLKYAPIVNILPDENDIYHKLKTLIINKDKIVEISKNSREYVEKLHDYKVIAKKFCKIYQEDL